MFKTLRSRLTALYVGLFAFAISLVAVAVYLTVSTNAENAVRQQLQSSKTVFERVWALKAGQMMDGANLLSRDFGFRSAYASADEETVISALENLRSRLKVDQAFILNLDGAIVGAEGVQPSPKLAMALLSEASNSGVLSLADGTYQAVAAPILSPTVSGWVVFASHLDQQAMTDLEKLSPIPLSATVQLGGGASLSAPMPRAEAAGLRRAAPRESAAAGRQAALTAALPTLGDLGQARLALTFPLDQALAPYRLLLLTIWGTGALALCLLVVGSWALARSVTRPITALDQAARDLQSGRQTRVVVEGQDEIARLAQSFNQMAEEIRARENRIWHMARHDHETELPNRLALEQGVEALTAEAADPIYVAAIGQSRFAQVRAAIGYRLADQLLQKLGHRLMDRRVQGLVGRVSTDTLGLVFRAASDQMAVAMLADLIDLVDEPVLLDDTTVDLLLNVGVARHLSEKDFGLPVIERASIALDQARGRHQKVGLFDAEAYGDPASKLSMMSQMIKALEDGYIHCHYQPKYDIRLGRITSCEALVRWNEPDRGYVPPDQFIPLAEETGAIRPLTEALLVQVIEDQKIMQAAGVDLAVSVNVSGRLIGDEDFAVGALELVSQAVGKICFEITETAVINNPELGTEILERYTAAGIDISIDDYGSGLSSLSYLKQIKAQELKIDKTFVDGMSNGRRDILLVRSTVDLAHGLGMKVTAEGVETATQMSLLTSMSCDMIQGWFVAKAMPCQDLIRFMSEADEESASRPLTNSTAR